MAQDGWFYERDGRQMGPVPFDRLAEMVRAGQVASGDLVWCSEMADWQPVASIPGLRAHPVVIPPPPVDYAGHRPGPMPYQSYGGGQSYQGFAIAGFVLSFMFPLLGLIFAWVALSGMKRTGNDEGRGLATAGVIISLVWISLGCLWIVGIASCFMPHVRL